MNLLQIELQDQIERQSQTIQNLQDQFRQKKMEEERVQEQMMLLQKETATLRQQLKQYELEIHELRLPQSPEGGVYWKVKVYMYELRLIVLSR